ncbi:GNAT family N-acetyltransferase [Granulosicoccaceae sp. 1_MG-2023]|nr:GNAT family N-acetyltransferase [Granulosicoccaceae sp. 1_MG-2023]
MLNPTIAYVGSETVWPLRHAVFFAGKRLSAARLPADKEALHLCAVLPVPDTDLSAAAGVIAVASVYPQAQAPARLRFLATDPQWRRQGLALRLLGFLFADPPPALRHGLVLHAESTLRPLYEQAGLHTDGAAYRRRNRDYLVFRRGPDLPA